MRIRATALAAMTSIGVLASGGEARALDCTTLPNAIIVAGSTAVEPVLAAVAKVLAAGSTPTTIVYAGQGSCNGVDDILNGTPVTGSGATALVYWDDTGAQHQCDVAPDGGGVVADIGVSDVFASTCVMLPSGLPSNIHDFLGPVQAMTFVVPKTSMQTSISAEAAYFAYGFGAASGVAPWTDPSVLFARDPTSGTESMIATAIEVPAAKWLGTPTTSTTDLEMKLIGVPASKAEGAIGILSAEAADANRSVLTVLAYQHYEQTCGYYPDKDVSSNEKQNVRDGHYAIWGPLHLLSQVGADGYPMKSAASDVVGFLTGTKKPPLGLDLIQFEAQAYVIPECAMRVMRTEEIGAMASFAPQGACGCYYEKVANGSTSCTACNGSTDCSADAPVCSYGYCETQ